MLDKLRAFFDQQVSSFASAPDARHSLELAASALLLEISRADDDVSARERDVVAAAIKQVFALTDTEIEDLVETATQIVEDAVSLYDFTAIVNERFSRTQKVELLEALWAVAYADERLDRYEEYYMRKISDLLHMSHSDYIKAKHKAMPSS